MVSWDLHVIKMQCCVLAVIRKICASVTETLVEVTLARRENLYWFLEKVAYEL